MKRKAPTKKIEISERRMLSLVREHWYRPDGPYEDAQYSEYLMMCMGYDVLKLVNAKLARINGI